MNIRTLTIEPPKGISLEEAKIVLKHLKFKIIEQVETAVEADEISGNQEKEIMEISQSINKNGAKKWFAKKGIKV